MQPDVGHYGVFNGSRFRAEIAPRIMSTSCARLPQGQCGQAEGVHEGYGAEDDPRRTRRRRRRTGAEEGLSGLAQRGSRLHPEPADHALLAGLAAGDSSILTPCP
jgi:hypothetical protein